MPRFYNRLASPTAQLVATSQPVADALSSLKLTAPAGQRLVMVELHREAPATLPGELARLGSFAILATDYSSDLHAVAGYPTLYGEELGTKEFTYATASNNNSAALLDLKLPTTPTPFVAGLTIDRAYLETHVRQLSGDLPVTVAGQELTIPERRMDDNKANARAWLRQEYEALGFTVSEVDYSGRSFGRSANFVAEKVGADPSRVLIISSHLDSVGNAGADDNGAGTISALAVARALKDAKLQYTLRLVAFDEEELGWSALPPMPNS